MKKIFLIICIALVSFANAQTKRTVTAKTTTKNTTAKTNTVRTTASLPKNSIDSFSYAVGVNIATNLRAQGIEQIDYASFQKAMADVFAKRPLLLNEEQSGASIQKRLVTAMSSKAAAEKAEGKKFLAENKKRPGVVELPNGLQYEIIKQGTGEKPKATDTVKAHYIGMLINGKEFDNSYKRGEPLQIQVNAVIPGWTQALQMMPVGSKWKLYIPSDLAYGDRGAGGAIPGGATLIFDVELMDIVHNSK